MIVNLSAPRPATLLRSRQGRRAGRLDPRRIGRPRGRSTARYLPVQQRNLEKAWGAKVIDRNGLILEIFGQRARTREGALQVELAHLSYQKSRLVRSWTHLERQRGGFGFLGGPGETQIEADRRQIQDRMRRIERELDGVKQTRSLHRASRRRVPVSDRRARRLHECRQVDAVQPADCRRRLRREPSVRNARSDGSRVRLPHGETAILSDTVGFISDLPTMLVAAFRATLEDVVEADLLLHVRDISHAETEAEASDVEARARSARHQSGRPRAADRGLEQDSTSFVAGRRATASPGARPAGMRPATTSRASSRP